MKVLIFGDSFSCEFDKISKEYVEWKGYIPKNFGEILKDEFKSDYLNFAKPGIDNYTIFHSIFDNVDIINDDDIIIVGWSTIDRFRIASILNVWMTVAPSVIESITSNNLLCDISKESLLEVMINRNNNYNLYMNEINSFIKIINYTFKNNKIIHWSWKNFNNKVDLTFEIYRWNTILDETNGEINDYHLNEEYSKNLSKIMINNLKKD